MLVNLPYHIRDSIQLSNDIIELVSTSKSPSTLDLLELNLKPQKINEITNHVGFLSRYDIRTINGASSSGCIYMPEWWKNSKLPLKYSENAINWASLYGHVSVLEWWKNSKLPLKYSENAIDLASSKGDISVLEWWKNSGLNLEYTSDSLNWGTRSCNNIEVLEWWKKSGLQLKYNSDAITLAAAACNIKGLEWWSHSGLELKYDISSLHYSLHYLIKNNKILELYEKDQKFRKIRNLEK